MYPYVVVYEAGSFSGEEGAERLNGLLLAYAATGRVISNIVPVVQAGETVGVHLVLRPA